MFWPDGIVCYFVIFSSSCQTLLFLDRRYCLLFSLVVVRPLLCFGQTVLFVIFSSSWSDSFMFWTDGIVCYFSSSCQTLLCFGQTVLFIVCYFL